jgi:hypothetical protein
MSAHEPPPVAVEVRSAVRLALGTLRQLLATDDPKTSLRAAAELTKLVSVCVRYGIDTAEPAPVTPPVEPKLQPVQPRPLPRTERVDPLDRPKSVLPLGGRTLTSFLGPPGMKSATPAITKSEALTPDPSPSGVPRSAGTGERGARGQPTPAGG